LIHLRLGLQQRVFPAYRAAFFDALAAACERGLFVFAGDPRTEEALGEAGVLRVARYAQARNIHLSRGPLLVYWQAGLLRWLEEWQPDALILEVNPRNLSNRAAIRWMHARGRTVIGWGLGPGGTGPAGSLLSRARTGYLRHFDALVAYSVQGAEQFAAAGFSPQRIFVAPNAVTPRPSSPPPERSACYRDGKPAVLFVGRLQARKRVDSLLRACAALPAEIQPSLTIVGDGPERSALEELARTVYPRAVFPGAKTGADLDPYYAAADLFVLPGTGGLAIQQAMSHGLPVLVGEADGTQSDLVRAGNGWIIPPGDEAALVECLKAALFEVERLRQMGSESYRIVAEEVNLEKMVEVFEKTVKAVIAETQKG
jgi:glycosyltransferase involved in cell wall biosynthesis